MEISQIFKSNFKHLQHPKNQNPSGNFELELEKAS